MSNLSPAILANFESFTENLPREISAKLSLFSGDEKLAFSYARLSAFNSFKRDLVDKIFSEKSGRFLHEAHSDLLVSHVNASMGAWRAALQALRSFLENSMSAIFYNDHPVELIQWENGCFRVSAKELRNYCGNHPYFTDIKTHFNIQASLDEEYATLSKAVHASNELFRMTDTSGRITIATPNVADLGKWGARQSRSFDVVALMLVTYLRDNMDGAKCLGLKGTLSQVMGSRAKGALLNGVGILVDV
ncbi:hypothetical protein [Tritonibacter scottomollicae]|uniref:hypothetical protein n=1 Tax=Tritonibacter scottomollicae TaxID=483013 RepID=UPI003AA9E159